VDTDVPPANKYREYRRCMRALFLLFSRSTHDVTWVRVRGSLCVDATFESIPGLLATKKTMNLNVAVDVVQQQGQRCGHTFIYMHIYLYIDMETHLDNYTPPRSDNRTMPAGLLPDCQTDFLSACCMAPRGTDAFAMLQTPRTHLGQSRQLRASSCSSSANRQLRVRQGST
jgi:hypothetical protein